MTSLDTQLADATSHHNAGRLSEAEAGYRAALALAPGRASVLHNLGVVLAAQGRLGDALALFDRAIAAEPMYAAAHYNRGVALQTLAHTGEALASYTRAAAIDPGHYEAHRALGFLWLAQGNRGRALDHFARTYELRRGDDRSGVALRSLTHTTAAKLRHDADLLAHIAASKRDGRRFLLLARAYQEVARQVAAADTELSAAQLDMLGEDYNTAIHIAAAPEIAGAAVNPVLDPARIVDAYRAHAHGAVEIDELLTPAALAGLRRFLLGSTIWHDFAHIGGFVASYLEDGLACPLLLQIADELRAVLPDLLGAHPLSQAWAFKGLSATATVAAHADAAAISLNLWLTPDAANLDPTRGGLVVCRAPPPAAWEIRGYEADRSEIAAFMAAHGDDALIVPYRENRAVLFESRLFHSSDAPHFAPAYASHRINLTLLFGG